MCEIVNILTRIRVKEFWNNRFRFGRSGLLFVLIELVAILTIIAVTSQGATKIYAPTSLESSLVLLFVITFFITLGNGYVFAERVLFGRGAWVDRFLSQKRDEIVLSSVIVTYLANLRPTICSPSLIAIVLTYFWFPHLQWIVCFLVVLVPLMSTITAVFLVIIIRNFSRILCGMAMLMATIFQLFGWILTVWFLISLSQGTVLFRFEVEVNTSWIFALIMTSGMGILSVLWISPLWEGAIISEEGHATPKYDSRWSKSIMALLTSVHISDYVQALVLKEWLTLWRNPITIMRVFAWISLSLLVILIPQLSLVFASLPSPLLGVFLIWYFCFGELVTTTYQAESDRLAIWWLAAMPPKQMVLAKILAYSPLTILVALMTGVLVVSAGLGTTLHIALSFTGTLVGIAISLIPASLAMNTARPAGNSFTEMVLEQVPTTLSSLGSTMVLGGVLLLYVILDYLMGTSLIQSRMIVLIVVLLSLILMYLAIVISRLVIRRRYAL